VPRRVAVTGSRGKSSVTRLIAAGLRASGARVLAKTTGSRPALILPDGSEREIVRAGPPSIREQVRLLALAAATGADTLVSEMMSIGAECLAAESRSILKPGTLALTNVRLDHTDEMGRDRSSISRALAAAIPAGADIFIPEEEVHPAFEEAATRGRSRLHPVALDAPTGGAGDERPLPFGEFEPNWRLARGVLSSLGIDAGTIGRGLFQAAPDPGGLRVWRVEFGEPPLRAVCVSLFAANEPESSTAALLKVREIVPGSGRPFIGLLSLREDRADRTLQWVRAAGEGFFRDFSVVILIGPPARPALKKIRRLSGPDGPILTCLERPSPEEVMGRILSLAAGEAVVVGLGNFVGFGADIVRFWESIGTAYDR
jgi:poly-gamma-glutamate synthase PgsB/CapB